jgi:uncharacterized phage protein (predicted DNA packaging)
MTLDDVKVYLRIDGNDDDPLLTSLMSAADSYIVNAVGDAMDKTAELYILASKLLITHWYENREPVGNANALAFSLQSILMQLKYTLPATVSTPLTVMTSPADEAFNVAVNSQLLWTFSVEIESDTVTSANFFVVDSSGNIVDGNLVISVDGKTVTFQTTNELASQTSYTMFATTNVRDITGNTMASNSVTNFTTA